MPFFNNDICGMVQALNLEDGVSYIPVPLNSVHMDIRVVNFTSVVEITQEFVNKEKNPIDCVYFFPVEEEAAVTDFSAELEGKVIKTAVKEKKDAREDYNRAVNNHQTAFLLEETKPDIFEIKVGHLSPGAGCKVSITYISELPVEDEKTRMTVPTTVAPRYTPPSDQSEESRKIASIQHDFQSPVKMTMNMEIFMKTEIISVTSPSHSLAPLTKEKNGEYFQSDCKFAGNSTDMDRDMVIIIETEEPNKPKVFVEKNESGSTVAMLSLVPEFKLKEHQIEAVFLVDCSGSMSGSSMNLAKEALNVFLHSLPVNSYFNIIMFGSSYKSMFPNSKIYDDNSLAEAKGFVNTISANLGGTEIYRPMEHIFNLGIKTVGETKLPRQVFILTDGEVGNSLACIQLVKKHNNNNRVFCLGIGSAADRHLVKGMARAGQGTATFTTEGESITAKVISQLKNGLQPCITDIKVTWGNVEDNQQDMESEIETKKTLFGYGKPKKQETKNATKVKNQAPECIPAIYDGSRLIVYKLFDENALMSSVSVKALTPEGQLDLTIPIDEDSFIEGDYVHKLYARKKIQDIEESTDDDNAFKKKNITEIALKFQLASQYTSFVGFDQNQNKSEGFSVTRHVRNQLPHQYGFRSAPGGAPGAPPGAAPGAAPFGFRSPPGAAPSSRMRMSKASPPGARPFTDVVDGPSHSSGKAFGRTNVDSASNFSLTAGRIDMNTGSLSLGGSRNSVNKSKELTVVLITSCQAANGSFSPTDGLAASMNVDLNKVLKKGKELVPKNVPDEWMTLVVVTYLREVCGDHMDIWELVVEKAERWLNNCVAQISDDVKGKTTQFVLRFSNNI